MCIYIMYIYIDIYIYIYIYICILSLSSQGMTRTNPTEVYLRPEGIFAQKRCAMLSRVMSPKHLTAL